MPKKTLPTGWPNAYDLLKDPNWEENYPMLFLRQIYRIMLRASGDEEQKFVAGFNIGLHKLTLVAKPPRLHLSMISKGLINKECLTSYGIIREQEVLGELALSQKSIEYYGNKTKREMAAETLEVMKKLRIKLAKVRAITSEPGMPPVGAQP